MSKADLEAAIAKNTGVFAEKNPMAGNKLPVSELLKGKELTLRYDDAGSRSTITSTSVQNLRWRREGETAWHEERYESWEAAPGVIMFGHLLSGAPDHDACSIVIDFDQALVRACTARWARHTWRTRRHVKTCFGVIEMEGLTPPKYRRHQFTDELVGRAITWNYSPGLTSMHLYSTPHSFSWIIFLGTARAGSSGAARRRT